MKHLGDAADSFIAIKAVSLQLSPIHTFENVVLCLFDNVDFDTFNVGPCGMKRLDSVAPQRFWRVSSIETMLSLIRMLGRLF